MITVAMLPPLPPPAHIVRIARNGGGDVAGFGRRVQAYIDQKSRVRVTGECDSACTMVTAVPADHLCFGPAARLGFHQAFRPIDGRLDAASFENRDDAGVAFLNAYYPQRLKDWIAARGGLTAQLIYLEGAELRSMFPSCR